MLRPADYKRVFDNACRVGNRHLTILATANGLDHPRLGLAIARKHVRRAVDRNRIKRQVRETFRTTQDAIGPLDVVVLARPGAQRLTAAELRTALETLWRELAHRCANS